RAPLLSRPRARTPRPARLGARHIWADALSPPPVLRGAPPISSANTLSLARRAWTPGWFGLRGVIAEVPLPTSLAGARVLDVGTFDGFWAFEMERRGAAEVVAIDVLDPAGWDWPPGSDDAVVREIGKRKAQGAGFL